MTDTLTSAVLAHDEFEKAIEDRIAKLFIQHNAMEWVHVFDDGGSGSPSLRYGIDAIPTALLIDREGKLLGMAHSTLGLDAQIESALR